MPSSNVWPGPCRWPALAVWSGRKRTSLPSEVLSSQNSGAPGPRGYGYGARLPLRGADWQTRPAVATLCYPSVCVVCVGARLPDCPFGGGSQADATGHSTPEPPLPARAVPGGARYCLPIIAVDCQPLPRAPACAAGERGFLCERLHMSSLARSDREGGSSGRATGEAAEKVCWAGATRASVFVHRCHARSGPFSCRARRR